MALISSHSRLIEGYINGQNVYGSTISSALDFSRQLPSDQLLHNFLSPCKHPNRECADKTTALVGIGSAPGSHRQWDSSPAMTDPTAKLHTIKCRNRSLESATVQIAGSSVQGIGRDISNGSRNKNGREGLPQRLPQRAESPSNRENPQP